MSWIENHPLCPFYCFAYWKKRRFLIISGQNGPYASALWWFFFHTGYIMAHDGNVREMGRKYITNKNNFFISHHWNKSFFAFTFSYIFIGIFEENVDVLRKYSSNILVWYMEKMQALCILFDYEMVWVVVGVTFKPIFKNRFKCFWRQHLCVIKRWWFQFAVGATECHLVLHIPKTGSFYPKSELVDIFCWINRSGYG